ncbi:Ff.00g017710.m01.CDS01 [Fusarium sp. VM40]|nr:Ff.00g017710.m01.CDS01 [Fusarium sp. VM40]
MVETKWREFFKTLSLETESSCGEIVNPQDLAKQIKLYPRGLVGEVKTKFKEVIGQVERLVKIRTTEHEQRKYLSK